MKLTLRRYEEFEKLVAALLSNLGFRVELGASARSGRIRQIDIMATCADGTAIPVEVKLPTDARVSLQRLRDMSSQTAGLLPFASRAKPLLVVGATANASNREWAMAEFGIDIWDREILLEKAGTIRCRFVQFFEQADTASSSLAVGVGVVKAQGPTAKGRIEEEEEEEEEEPPPAPQGADLIGRLQAIKPGKKQAKAFEAICQDIITYVFPNDLRDARSQSRTEDNLNVYDITYRISPKHPFWVTLTRDFRARAVLFECKNYTKKIGPAQVFMTERYLSANALRPICFVLSRYEPHKHAIQAAFGAMREAGKVLLFLSDKDLIQMINARDAQLAAGGHVDEKLANDPTEVLDQKIYDFIAAMPR